MNRWLFLLGLLLVSSATLASSASFPDLFKPAPDDLSIWYLGNIFGSDLMGSLVESDKISGIRLLSVLFGIFNQIALVVGIIIIVYTILAGTLNTAHEGKPLGEKWNSVWMPVRTSMGIALLVPKGGSGYCLAQSLVMWLAVQGIGAADQVWNAMVDYFAQGGAIYSNHADQSGAYMTQGNIVYTLNLQGDSYASGGELPGTKTTVNLLKSMVCISTFNNDKAAMELNNNRKYEVYTLMDDTTHVYFGDRDAGMAAVESGYTGPATAGKECGAIVVTLPECDMDAKGSKCGTEKERGQIYTLANWNMAQGLQGLAKEISTNLNNDTNWDSYYSSVLHNSELYINYLVGYEDFLFYKGDEALKASKAFDVYKKYGWILAGNYYTILSGFKERVDYMTRKMIPPNSIEWMVIDGTSTEPKAKNDGDAYDLAYNAVQEYWRDFEAYMNYPLRGDGYSEYIASYGQGAGNDAAIVKQGKNSIGIVNMNEILKNIGNTGATVDKHGKDNKKAKSGNKKGKGKRGSGSKKGEASMATTSAVQNYIQYLTGEGSGSGDMRVAKDPILRASNFGKSLTSAALPLMLVATAIQMAAAAFNVCAAVQPMGAIGQAAIQTTVWGLMALGVFMYSQGAILGVFIPLIPYLTFFIGVVGWLLQVVEAVAAAPLVAIGLVFPETRDDIWGRAAPAYMMILALFLRPPLMLVGFAAAMIVLWVLTELLNIGFLTLTAVTFRIEDMFGFVVIMTAYTAIFTVVVTRSYELINVVPNKVLNWIGGPGMEVQGAGEAIGAAKGGVQEGAGAVGGGMSGTTGKAGGAYEASKKEKFNKEDAKANAASLNSQKPQDDGTGTK